MCSIALNHVRWDHVLMGTYVIEYAYDHSLDSLLQDFRPLHRQFLRDLHARGILRASGFLRDGLVMDALLILDVDSVAEAEEVLREDPFALQGLITSTRIREWVQTIGDGAEGFDTEFPIS